MPTGPEIQVTIRAIEQGFDQVINKLNNLKQQLYMIGQTSVVSTINNMSQSMQQLNTTVSSLSGQMNAYSQALQNVQASLSRTAAASRTYGESQLSLKGTLGSLIKDMELMMAVQMRWYGARAVLDMFTQVPIQIVKYAAEIDNARGSLLRWGATSGQVTATMRKDVEGMILAIRQAVQEIPVAFQEVQKSAEAFVGAGVSYKTVSEMVPDLAKLAAAFPEIQIEQFAVAMVGAFNTFRSEIKQATSDADAFKIIIEELLRAQAIGVIRPEQFTKVLQYMGPISKMAGFTIEQMLSIAVAITETGTRAEKASRLAASFMTALTQEKARKNLESIGIELKKDETLAAQFDRIVTQLVKKIGTGAATVGSMSFLGSTLDKEQMSNFLAFLQQYEKYVQLQKDIGGAAGGLDAAASTRLDTIGGQWTILTNRVKEFGAMITGDAGGLKDFIFFLNEIVKGLVLASDSTGKFAKSAESLTFIGETARFVATSIMQLLRVFQMFAYSISTSIWSIFGWIFEMIGKVMGAMGFKGAENYLKEWAGTSKAAADIAWKEVEAKRDAFWGKLPSEGGKITVEKSAIPPTKLGEGINVPDKGGKGGREYRFTDQEIAAVKKYYAALLKETTDGNKQLMEVEKERYSEGATSIRENMEERIRISIDGYEQEIEIINAEEEELRSLYERKRGEINTHAKMTAEQKNQALQALEEKYSADLEVLILRRAEAGNRYEENNIRTVREARNRMRQIEASHLDAVLKMAEQANQRMKLLEESRLSNLQKQTDYEYGRGRISATGYYRTLEDLINEKTTMEMEHEERSFQLWKDNQMEEYNRAGTTYERRMKILDDISEKEETLTTKQLSLAEKAEEDIYSLRLKRANDIRWVYENMGAGGAVGFAAEELASEYKNVGKNLVDMTKSIATSMQENFSTIFFDAMKGKFDDLQTYAESFGDSILKAVSDAVTKYLVGEAMDGLKLLMNYMKEDVLPAILDLMKSFSSASGGGGEGGGGGWFGAVLGAIGSIFHSGGVIGTDSAPMRLVPAGAFAGAVRAHSGLGPGERPIIARDDESVLTPAQMRQLAPVKSAGAGGDSYFINIQAVDAKSFADLCDRNAGAIVRPIARSMKENTDFRGLMKDLTK